MTSLPRVLFVDDDASIRHLVELALEELPIELVICASVAEARLALRQAPVKLIITDLMMPVESGFDLLQQLQDEPALRAGALQVVFSAGLMNADNRARLTHLDIWRELPKPVSVLDLEQCVLDALEPRAVMLPVAPTPEPSAGAAPCGSPKTCSEAEAQAMARNFGGDEAMYRAFLEACIAQFPDDSAMADRSFEQRDAVTLRRVAHNLKSVLFTLGWESASEQARNLEAAASTGNWEQAARCWPPVKQALLAMTTQAARPH